MRKLLIPAAAVILALGAATAGASISHVFGKGGVTYVFDAKCHRVTFVPPGISDHEAINVTAQQARCLVRRPDPFAVCVQKLGTPPTTVGHFDHGRENPADWTNVDKMAAYLAGVSKCSHASL